MRRLAAVEAEIARRLDEAGAEVGLPETIDHDAGEQRIARAADPGRQPLAPPGLGGVRLETEIDAGCHDRRDPAGLHDLSGLIRIASDLDVRRSRLARRDGVHARIGGHRGPQPLDLGQNPRPLFPSLARQAPR